MEYENLNKKISMDKIIKNLILISFITIGLLYWFSAIAMHRIYGIVSLIVLFILYIIYLYFEDIEIPFKQTITVLINTIIVLLVVFFHFNIVNHPFKIMYRNLEDGIEITGYKDKLNNNYDNYYLEIPTHINNKKVISIGKEAFINSRHVHKITIPSTIKTIKERAFYNSTVSELVIKDGVEIIEDEAFYKTGIKNLIIPSSVKYIGNNTFSNSPFIKAVVVVNTNDNIEKWNENWHDNSRQIFYNSIDFFEEDGITYVLHDNKQSSVVRITINNKNVKILEKIIYNEEEFLVTTIETGACLNNLFLTEFIIPNNIISIKKRAFVNNELLEKVYIPKSVLYLEENIFAVCEKLIIYTEHLEKPDGWSDDWNKENKEVNWNYQK